MRALSAAELLYTWEWGQTRHSQERALGLLAAHMPGQAPEMLRNLSIGSRDTWLLELRAQTFGPQLECQLDCPACQNRLEFDFQTDRLLAPLVTAEAQPDEIEFDGWRIRFRLPISEDLLGLEQQLDLAARRRALLQGCILASTPPVNAEVPGPPGSNLPAHVIEALSAEMQRRDAAANLNFALTCPACGHSWTAPFDIVSFFWEEITAWAMRTLREVHSIASVYGWREPDILALTALRRQLYVEMADGG
jgi:hypothetical protein